jgi:hypothetical protein
MAKRKKVDVEQLLRERLKELGAIGGKTTANKLSKDQRAEKAKKAAAARWGQAKLQDEPLKVHEDKLDTQKKPSRMKKGK